MVNNMREQLVKAGYAQNSRPNMQKKGQQFDFENFDVVTEAEKAIKGLQYKDRYDNTKIDGRLQVQVEQNLSSNYISGIHLIKKSVEQFIRSVVA